MKKIQFRKTDWESFKFWKSDEECYRRKRWLLGIFGFGLGRYLGQGTMYDMFYAVIGMAIFSFIGAIIDAIGVAKWNRTHEDVYLQQVLEEDRREREKEMRGAAKGRYAAETSVPETPVSEEKVKPESVSDVLDEDEEEEEVIIIDESLLEDIDDLDGEN